MRFGIVCEPVAGHLNPALTVGRALRRRGHEVVVFGIADVEASVVGAGLDFVQVGSVEFPQGALRQRWLAHPRGIGALVHTVRLHTEETDVLCRDVAAATSLALDALVVDQLHVCGPVLAEALAVPFVTLCAGPGMYESGDGSFPPPYLDREPGGGWLRRTGNRVGFTAMAIPAAPRLRTTNRHARRLGVGPVESLRSASSPLLQISALIAEMNFGVTPPAGHPMRLMGPLVDDARPAVRFPWHLLDDRPLVYASLGTVQAGAEDLRAMIVAACRQLGVQLVLTHGGTDEVRRQPDGALVVADAPQLELLERASVCITHCGLNTTMECAALGVPMVGLPIVYDQPAMAARIRAAGVGTTTPAASVTATALASMLDDVLRDPSYRRCADDVSAACRRAPGVEGAAALIE
ncbi:MAG: glycosyltransferase family 1 protein, partial [Propionibacterium sp.]|nr:glycosyltransferase family 1 protein [Propionibacterium sp.]